MSQDDADGSSSAARPRLEELLEELAEVRRIGGEDRLTHFESSFPKISAALGKVPLVHGLARANDFEVVVDRGRLDARPNRGKSPIHAEARLGIPPSIYTAAGVVYPNRFAALVFGPNSENNADVTASPWDSGHFCRTRRGKFEQASDDERRALFATYSLPPPEYREYLVAYVASCFGSAHDYIFNKPHRHADPLGVLDAEVQVSRIFEVRFRGKLTVSPEQLLAVFLPAHRRANVAGSLHERLIALRAANVAVCYYHGAKQTLRSRVRGWMREHLRISPEAKL